MYKIDGSELYESATAIATTGGYTDLGKEMSYGRGSGCLFRYWRAKIKGTIDG